MMKFFGKMLPHRGASQACWRQIAATITKATWIRALVVAIGLVQILSEPTSAVEGLSRGHNILIQKGLQLEASCSGSGLVEHFDLDSWEQSNFTAVHFWSNYPLYYMPPAPGLPWGFAAGLGGVEIPPIADSLASAGLAPYMPSMVSYQLGDENNITDPAIQSAMNSAFATFHTAQPDVLTFTNQFGGQLTSTQLRTYMQAVQPDMLMFDTYPFNGIDVVGGSPTGYYGYLQQYRKLGLAGNDGTGTKPIPVGFWPQTSTGDFVNNHVVSESEIRLNEFSGWAFGCKMASAFLYQSADPNLTAVMFTGSGTSTRTAQFNQIAETNRQSLNLGPALVRLLSTDVRMKMGEHTETSWFWPDYGAINDLPSDVAAWSSDADPYLTDINATNFGIKNDGRSGDVIVGYFKPLDESFTNEGHKDDLYFMIVNGLSDATGSAADCQQRIRLTFDFGTSGINSLERLSRETGQVEVVNLVHISGSQYSLDLTLDGGTGDLLICSSIVMVGRLWCPNRQCS